MGTGSGRIKQGSSSHDNTGLDKQPPEQWLLTPGPLTTDIKTREAMLLDWGSWDTEFCALTASIRTGLLDIAFNGNEQAASSFDCVPMQGSGTYLVEAMLGSFTTSDDRILVLSNGAYGKRIVSTLDYLKRDYQVIDKGDYLPPRATDLEAVFANDPAITKVVLVHCETSSGILNPLKEIAEVTRKHKVGLMLDSMSAFGALPLDMNALDCEAMVSSANKCIEGVPGFGFVIVRRELLEKSKGCSHSLSLDVHAQWDYMNKTGQWRFTPPTHAVAAFASALQLHRQQGGQAGRLQRYTQNRDTLVAGMRKLGFETLLDNQWLSPIIVTFFNPADSGFEFKVFYNELKARGFVIYPGKLTVVDSFRIGCIGNIDQQVVERLLRAVSEVLEVMGVHNPSAPDSALAERAVLLQQNLPLDAATHQTGS